MGGRHENHNFYKERQSHWAWAIDFPLNLFKPIMGKQMEFGKIICDHWSQTFEETSTSFYMNTMKFHQVWQTNFRKWVNMEPPSNRKWEPFGASWTCQPMRSVSPYSFWMWTTEGSGSREEAPTWSPTLRSMVLFNGSSNQPWVTMCSTSKPPMHERSHDAWKESRGRSLSKLVRFFLANEKIVQ